MLPPPPHNLNRGFSLVELSIVLVILGLLTGGILAGQSLIRAAELRAVSTEYSKYVTALGTFRDKYFAMPGDMSNATKFWLTATTCPGTSASPSTGTATCDGDGDGALAPNTANSNELFRAWQHLANAGLIEGNYTGVANSTTASNSDILFGTNIPKSKMSNSGWMLYTFGDVPASSTIYFEGSYGSILFFGASNPTCCPTSANLKPEEMWNVDTKLDDGKPGTGKVVTLEQNINCHDQTPGAGNLAGVASYALSVNATTCSMIFRNVF
ncbi:MAG: type II secretion system protein [Rickettsiales bacterium]